MGVTFRVEGYVIDEQEVPISNAQIRAWNAGSFERPPFDLVATSDETGYFQTESTFSYGCTSFEIEVVADSFVTQTLTYYPPTTEFVNELPEEITVVLKSLTD